MNKNNVLFDNSDRAKFEVGVIINWWDFYYLVKNSLFDFVEELDTLRRDVNKTFSTTYTTPVYVGNAYGELFQIYLNYFKASPGFVSLTFYDSKGSLTVWSGKFFDGDDHKSKLQDISKAINDFSVGNINCSDCGSQQKLSDIQNNRYFGGIYCDGCWNGKWKEIEAKETYN